MKALYSVVGMLCTLVCVIFEIVGLVTEEWEQGEVASVNSTDTMNAGLWKICSNGECTDRDEDWLKVCQVFGILGILLMVGCLFMEVSSMFCESCLPNWTIRLFAAADIFGAVFTLIEFAVYAGKSDDDALEFGYSFALTIVGFVLSIGGGISTCIAWRGEYDSD